MDKAPRQTDYLILGQGLAGTLLSFRLGKAGVEHHIIDRGHAGSSSSVAAGIVNPVTGRRFVKSWNIEALLENLAVYRELEKLLAIKLLNDITVYRDLSETSALNQWDMRRNDEAYASYMDKPLRDLEVNLNVPEIVGPTRKAAQVNLRELIISYRALALEQQILSEEEHSIDGAEFVEGRWIVGGFAARRIIDCTGIGAMSTDTWGKLPWRGTKGEAFRFSLPGHPREMAIKKKHFVCPIGTSDEVWLGGTNQDHYQDIEPSLDGRNRLIEQAKAFEVEVPITCEHLVAVRPSVNDRRPLIGEHPDLKGLWLCNGFGTKGTSVGPYCTIQLVEAMLQGKAINPEIDIANRFTQE